ncbi:MAG: DUF805 domain-containing protein [Hyphomicrobiaceae bacterium]|nr:DUF805 domain-containing protein [Hyphomicrobiaceae bacterium]
MSHTAFILMLFSPKGRCNPCGLLKLALVLLALQALALAVFLALDVPIENPLFLPFKVAFLWLAATATLKRLHDLGLGGQWIVYALLATVLWTVVMGIFALALYGVEASVPGSPGFLAYAIASSAPLVLAAVYLHCVCGEPDENRFGPVPGPSGFSMPEPAVIMPTARA